MTDLVQTDPTTLHAVVEVVRREKCQIASAVPVRLDDVVHVSADVFLVAREDDEVVEPCEVRSVSHTLEIVVGEHIHLLLMESKPPQETLVITAEVRWHTPIQEG